jgi:hypothetical protein
MAKRFTYKGKYIPINPKKYRGDITSITYRSMWERKFMKYCDTNDSVLFWSSEELIIPYISPLDKRIHKYYPDFVIQVKSKQNTDRIVVIEIKPKRETKKPKKKTKKTATYLQEVRTWGINSAKWKAAEEFCRKRNWEFKIMTEDHILP